MKKKYVAPDLEVEHYELNTSIAANCTEKPTMGPGVEGIIIACDGQPTIPGDPDFEMFSARQSSFYETGSAYPCECTYSSGGEGYFAS